MLKIWAGLLAWSAAVALAEPARDLQAELRQRLQQARYAEAEAWAREGLDAARRAEGAESPAVADWLDVLVAALKAAGEATQPEALSLAQRSLSIRETALGPDHPATAASLQGLGDVLRARGEAAAARPLYERALALRERSLGPDDLEVADSLGALGGVLADLGELNEAQRLCARALALRVQKLGADDLQVAAGHHRLGRVHFLLTDYPRARSEFTRALEIRRKLLPPGHPDLSAILNNLAGVHDAMGDYPAARATLALALEMKEKALGPAHPDVGLGSYNLGLTQLRLGEYEEARALFERSLVIFEKSLGPDHPYIAKASQALADLLLDYGDLAGARPLYERALALWEKALGPASLDLAEILESLASLSAEEADYVEARSLLERSLRIRETALGSDNTEVAKSLGNLAMVEYELRDPETSREIILRALALRERHLGPEHPELAGDLLQLGRLQRDAGDLGAAARSVERALAIREKALGPEHLQTIYALSALAEMKLALKDPASALQEYARALARLSGALGADHPGAAKLLDGMGRAHLLAGDLEAARGAYERSLAIFERGYGSDHADVSRLLDQLAALQWATGAPAPALLSSLRAARISRESFLGAARYLSEREALRYQASRVSGLDTALTAIASAQGSSLGPRAVAQVWDEVVRSRAMVLDEMASRHRPGTAAGDAPGLAAELRAARAQLARLLVRGADERGAGSYPERLRRARQRQESAERALAEQRAPARADPGRGTAGLSEVEAALPPGSALLAFVRYGEVRAQHRAPAYLALILKKGGGRPRAVRLGLAEPIEARIARWREEAGKRPPPLPGPSRRAEAEYREAAAELRQAVWDPVSPHLRDVRRLFIVPDGSLHLLSFGTLPAGENEYLAETGPMIHYLSAERDLVRPHQRGAPGRGMLALGAPQFDAAPGDLNGTILAAGPSAPAAAVYRGPRPACVDLRALRFEPLPSSGIEALEVETLWRSARRQRQGDPQAHVLTGAAASEPAFKTSAGGRRILHIATHSFFEPLDCGPAGEARGESPLLLSGLALAGANRRQEVKGPEDGEDGILTAEEIASLDLSGVEWAVLSACETGVGRVQSGEGVLGLRRAFEVAGAGSLIMSLWPVEDTTTREWMRALYSGRLRGLSTTEALHRAGLEVMEARRGAGHGGHPFYWGAFVAAGDWR